MLPSLHPMLVEVGNAPLNAVEDVTAVVVELDHTELGGRSRCEAVQQGYLTLSGGSLVERGGIVVVGHRVRPGETVLQVQSLDTIPETAEQSRHVLLGRRSPVHVG